MTDDDDQHQPQPRSQLFTLRIWRDAEQAGDLAPYMQVRHVLTGETRYFSAWPPLIDHVLGWLDPSHRP